MSLRKYYNLGKKVLFPINRSITGRGLKKSLNIIKKEFNDLKIKNIKSGTKVFDWKIPPEWNVNNAYVEDKNRKKIINFQDSNLHLVGYSKNIKKYIKKKKLLSHIYSLPKKPDAIPYITSYYKRIWGFCSTHKLKQLIKKNYKNNDKFKVLIDSNFARNGNLNYGELVIKGTSKKEILISTYICHPSMGNNELSGPIVCMGLIKYFKKYKKIKKTLRFIFVPETIGSIAYINKNFNKLKKNVIAGYNLTCIGDNNNHSCMFTKYGNSPSDIALKIAYKKLKIKYKTYPFSQRGSDERQYNSPGVDLPIASIFRTKYHEYSEYHTSLDNFNFISLKGITGGYDVVKESIKILLEQIFPESKYLCEPFLSKRKLYPTLSRGKIPKLTKKILDVLQYCDGKNDLDNISKKTLINKNQVVSIYKLLLKKNLIKI